MDAGGLVATRREVALTKLGTAWLGVLREACPEVEVRATLRALPAGSVEGLEVAHNGSAMFIAVDGHELELSLGERGHICSSVRTTTRPRVLWRLFGDD